jgi:hypothetical protein
VGKFRQELAAGAGALNQDIPTIEIVPLTADITKFAQPVERTAYGRLRDAEHLSQTAYGMGSVTKIDRQHKRHLARRKIGCVAANARDQRVTPQFERLQLNSHGKTYLAREKEKESEAAILCQGLLIRKPESRKKIRKRKISGVATGFRN